MAASESDIVELPNGETYVLPDPDNILGYARLARWKGQDLNACRLMFAKFDLFPGLCKIQTEDSRVEFLDITPAQIKVLAAYERERWVIVSKYRQAKITTISLMRLLRDCMYLEGHNGVITAETNDTAKDVLRRLVFAYDHFPDSLRAPLDPARKGRAEALYFDHGGSIQIMSAQALSPGVGRSLDRLLFTEIGEVPDLSNTNKQLFPTISKRKNARVWAESTPGAAGSDHEHMWRNALKGESRFHAAVWLSWWKDDTCWMNPDGFVPTDEELEYMERHEGMDFGNLRFRRMALNTEFGGDPILFTTKYPSHELDGWLGGGNPVVPTHLLMPMREEAQPDPKIDTSVGIRIFEPPVPGRQYIIAADPAGFGETGDESCLLVFDAWDNREVACWAGREAPNEFADRLVEASDHYNKALLAVESNAEAVVSALHDRGYGKRMYWSRRRHPGWYASTLSVKRGEARLVEMLQAEEVTIQSRETIDQLIRYSPDNRSKRTRKSDTASSHYDRARAAVIYADVRMEVPIRRPKKVTNVSEKRQSYRNGDILARDFFDFGDEKKKPMLQGGLPYRRRR